MQATLLSFPIQGALNLYAHHQRAWTIGNGQNKPRCQYAEVVMIAVMWWPIPDVVNELKHHPKGKNVGDISNAFAKDGNPIKLEKQTGTIIEEPKTIPYTPYYQ